MRKSFIITFFGGLILISGIFGWNFMSDYLGIYYEKNLRRNICKVKEGMSKQEVIEILGEPVNQQGSDISGTYWCYEKTSVFSDDAYPVGLMALEMSRNGKVVRIFMKCENA
jgi:hypothetical protein